MNLVTKTCATFAVTALALSSGVATAAEHQHGNGDGKSGYSLSLRIERVKSAAGQVKFTVTPEGFTYVKVPDDGAPNVVGEGHAHIYAKDAATGKVRYIGWTGNGLTDWSDPDRLVAGKTYRIYAIFSESDHTERSSIRSRAVVVTMR